MTMNISLVTDRMNRSLFDYDMRNEHIDTKQPATYATLEEALQAKMERTKRLIDKLNPEARARLIDETTRDQKKALPDD